MTTLHTPQGDVNLLPPSVELLRTIGAFLPFGMVSIKPRQRGADFGFVMQCGERELHCLKQQPMDCDANQSKLSYQANTILIVHSLAEYLKNGFSGLFMPCGYIRTKEGGRFESGIAYFGYPSSHGRESQEYPFEPAFDGDFGHGFTVMAKGFIAALSKSSSDTGLPLFQTIGLDVRPRLHLGTLGFGFMLVGPHVICLKTVISQEDPIWGILRSTGITQVFHIPSISTAIREDQLPKGKPGG